jgi:hypothetical protein
MSPHVQESRVKHVVEDVLRRIEGFDDSHTSDFVVQVRADV